MTTEWLVNPVGRAARIRVAPAHTEAEWAQARRLTGELVDWLADELQLNVRADQHDSNEELDEPERFYSFPGGMFLLGYLAEVPSGTTAVHMMDPETAELRRVWVTSAARGHGVAPALLRAAILAAEVLGARRIRLETAQGAMDRAIAMYRRAGFREIPHYTSLVRAVPSLVSMELAIR